MPNPSSSATHRPAWEAQDRRNFYLNLGFGLDRRPGDRHPRHRGRRCPSTTTTSRRSAASTASRSPRTSFSDRIRDRGLAARGGRAPDPHADPRRPPDRRAGRRRSSRSSTSSASSSPAICARAAHRHQAPGEARRRRRASPRRRRTSTPGWSPRRRRPSRATPGSSRSSPSIDAGRVEPTAAQKAAAKAKAEAALTRPPGRQVLGRRRQDRLDRRVDAPRRPATSAGSTADDSAVRRGLPRRPSSRAEVNTPTAVIEGADGIYRIGRVTEIAAGERRPGVPGQDRRTTASTSTSTARSWPATSSTRSSRPRSSPT